MSSIWKVTEFERHETLVPMSQIVCVTGGTGFVGKHLTRSLAQNGFEVVVLSRRTSPAETSSARISFVQGDLTNPEDVGKFLRKGAALIHLSYLKNPADNFMAVDLLIRESKKAGIQKLIHCSTAVVTGKTSQELVTEETACQPQGEYEETKKKIEDRFLSLDGIPTYILRPTAIFGSGGMNLKKTLGDLKRTRCESALRLSLLRNRNLNLVSVQNVVSALEFLLQRDDLPSKSIFIASEDDCDKNNYKAVAERFYEKRGEKMPFFLPLPRFMLNMALKMKSGLNSCPNHRFSPEKLKAAGWRPAISFEHALDRYLSENP